MRVGVTSYSELSTPQATNPGYVGPSSLKSTEIPLLYMYISTFILSSGAMPQRRPVTSFPGLSSYRRCIPPQVGTCRAMTNVQNGVLCLNKWAALSASNGVLT
jgi:hypothetical protein